MSNLKEIFKRNYKYLVFAIIGSIIFGIIVFFIASALFALVKTDELSFSEKYSLYLPIYFDQNWWIILLITFLSLVSLFVYFLYKNIDKGFIKKASSSELGEADWLINQKANPNQSLELFTKEYPQNEVGFVVLMQKQQNQKTKETKYNFYTTPEKHVLVLAGAGGGKTQKIVIPSIFYNATLENAPTMFIADPKGDVSKQLTQHLIANGYQVYTLDLREPDKSLRWNPLSVIFNLYQDYKINNKIATVSNIENLINLTVNSLLPNEASESSVWNQNARNILKGSIYAFLESDDLLESEFNLATILETIKTPAFSEYLKKLNEIKPNNHFFKYLANSLLLETEATREGYLGNLNKIALFNDESIAYITSHSDFYLKDLVNQKAVLFAIVPDEDTSKHAIISMLINQLYYEAIKIASSSDDIKLKRVLQFYCEEAANIPKIDDLDSKISASRSRQIFFLLVLQSLNQLKTKYGNSAKTILDNLQTKIFLNVNEEDAKTLSASFGKKTVVKTSLSGKYGTLKQNDLNYSNSLSAIDLITAGDIENLKEPFGFITKKKTKPSLVNFDSAYQNPMINTLPLFVANQKTIDWTPTSFLNNHVVYDQVPIDLNENEEILTDDNNWNELASEISELSKASELINQKLKECNHKINQAIANKTEKKIIKLKKQKEDLINQLLTIKTKLETKEKLLANLQGAENESDN